MSTTSKVAADKIGALSKAKAQLLERLLEDRARRAQRITPAVRSVGNGILRLPASWAQERLWFISQLETKTSAYHITIAARLRGVLNRYALQKALDTLVQRHEVLRTVFHYEGDNLSQEIAEERNLPLASIDLRLDDPGKREASVQRCIAEETEKKFDLSSGPLARSTLLCLSSQEHILLITMHHIISDGWSIGILVRELADLYEAYWQGRVDPLAPLPIQYADYALWQRQWLQGSVLDKQLNYWRNHLGAFPPILELPTDRPRPPVQSYRGDAVSVSFDASLSARLKALARRLDMTLFMVVYTGWAIVLSRLSGQADLVIGTPISNRQRSELEGLIGFFVNTLPIRVEIKKDLSVFDLLTQVKEATLAAYDNQDVPFEHLVQILHPHRSLSRNPLFQVILAMQNVPKSDLRLQGLEVTLEGGAPKSAVCDLALSLEEHDDLICGDIYYATDLFNRDTIQRWTSCLVTLLNEIQIDVDRPIDSVPILAASERRKLVELFNSTQREFPRDESVHRIFEEQARRTPDAVAVAHEGESLTYAQLNRKANQLGRYLRHRGVQVGEYVPVVMPRCPQIFIAQLALLKSGCVYVPLDPKLPSGRLKFTVSDCAARVALCNNKAECSEKLEEIEWIDCTEAMGAIAKLSTDNLELRLDPPPPAYIMYTSGSTGTPKGVVIPHCGVNRLALNNGYAQISPSDCIAHCSNPAFDASTFDIWVALLNGAKVLIVPQEVVLDAARLSDTLKQQQVSALLLTTGLFVQNFEELSGAFTSLKYVITGGDTLDPRIAERLMWGKAPQYMLNAYGPTETTTFATTYRIRKEEEVDASVPIGRPISNTNVYILDARLQPVPIGVTGEIYIGGVGVALGYLNRPEQTAESFVADPFCFEKGTRLYKTGDLGCWRADGNVMFLGRRDHQVKIRGFRVELDEIEAQLLKNEWVKEAAVCVREEVPGEKALVAYVILGKLSDNLAPPGAEMLRISLNAALPDYMVPHAFVVLDRFPLTSTGKVDRAALPAPAPGDYVRRGYDAPLGDVEETLADIWREVLRLDCIGRNDDFFALGGHSLNGMKVMAAVAKRLGVKVPITYLFQYPTISGIANAIGSLQAQGEATVESDDLEFDEGLL